MPDVDPLKNPKKQTPSNADKEDFGPVGVIVGIVVFWGSLVAAATSYMLSSDDIKKDNTHAKSKQLNALEMGVGLIDKQAKFLDTFIAAAKAELVQPSECVYAYKVIDSSKKDMEELNKDISMSARYNVISVSEAASYRQEGRRAYNRVTMKMEALNIACDDLFNAAAIVSANQNVEPISPWWQKPEFSINLNK